MLYQTENQHGGDVYGGGITLDFSANTNPLGTPPGVLEAVRRGLTQLHRYPDPYCRQLVQAISSRNITELCTRFADPVNAHVLVGIDIKNSDEVASVLEDLRAAGFSACDLTDNELAKLHLRHMVGGNAPQVANERLLRFAFPERPGALLDFMDAMRVEFNITLFQYRYHGADYGRVLVGFDAPEDQREAFEDFLARVERMGYPHVDESDNPAYKMFLGWHDA